MNKYLHAPPRNPAVYTYQKRCKDNSREECPICLDPLPEKDCTLLKCDHTFHYACILDWYLSDKCRRVCPICRKDGGVLPLPKGEEIIPEIHEVPVVEPIQVKRRPAMIQRPPRLLQQPRERKQCQGIIKSKKSVNYGIQCKNRAAPDSNYCKRHG